MGKLREVVEAVQKVLKREPLVWATGVDPLRDGHHLIYTADAQENGAYYAVSEISAPEDGKTAVWGFTLNDAEGFPLHLKLDLSSAVEAQNAANAHHMAR